MDTDLCWVEEYHCYFGRLGKVLDCEIQEMQAIYCKECH